MSSILREISEWSATLPYWEQAALEKIVSGANINDAVYDELLQYLLEDAGLAEQLGTRPELHFPYVADGEEEVERHNAIRLKRISNLRNINALVPDQILEFCDQLTVIFGSNGSGKSGYARVLASASFTRGDKQILRDISKPMDDTDPLSADLDLDVEGRSIQIHHKIGEVCPEMHSFYVFDSTSVRAHLTRSNPMSFSPAGLEYLTRFAEVTDAVRKCLQQRVDQLNCANPFPMRFVGGETSVTRIMNDLGPQTDLTVLRQLGTLKVEEIQKIKTLDQDIAKLKSENIPKKIAELNQIISDLNLLVEKISGLDEILNDQQVTLIHGNIQSWQNANQVSQTMGVEQFNNPWFEQTGSQIWYDFINAAHRLSQSETHDNVPYPDGESHCLLCQQPLNSEAQELLKRLWAFLLSDAQDKLEQAIQKLEVVYQQLLHLDFDLLDDQTVSYRHLLAQDSKILQRTHLYIQSLSQRSDTLINSIQKHEISKLNPLPPNSIGEINQIIGRISEQRDELTLRQVETEIHRLTQEKLELEHRFLLSEVLDDVVHFVENTIWIEIASSARVKRSTAHISKKYNELFDRLVTQEYLRLFQEALENLKCPLLIRIATRAQKGEIYKQIALQTDVSVSPEQAPPDKVLSEGEQRAVALADFFTEVQLDKQSCGVILDDPVSSLDFQWKDTIAGYIVNEATRQQVVLFTHDLHFLYLIKEKTEPSGIPIKAHWIEKRENKPGWVFQNNSPLSEKEYKTSRIPNEIYAKVKNPELPSDEQQRLLREGFGALRTCYEAFVMYDLFNGVVLRFEERTRIDQLGKVVIDPKIRDKAVEKMALLSRFIEGHLHSDTSAAQKPTPDIFLQEIEEFERLKKLHKEFKKSQGIKD